MKVKTIQKGMVKQPKMKPNKYNYLKSIKPKTPGY